jgi:hypothetical protein
MKQGQSDITPQKENAFGGIFYWDLTIQKKFASYYHHFDLNAGCGYNHDAQCDGSPIVFLDAARRSGVGNFFAHFVDQDGNAIKELQAQVTDDRCTVYNGDNREFVKAIPDLIRLHGGNLWDLGTVLSDPNGIDIPIRELADLSRTCPRLDFVVNYPARVWKRVRAAGFESGKLYLDEMLRLLNKKEWLIQCPLLSDPHEWMILIGRNFPMGEWRKMRIYKLYSPEGQECLRRSYSQSESTDRLF